MFYAGFVLRNPWSNRFSVVKEKTISISTNKAVEVGIYRNNAILGGSIGITAFNQDHAGFSLDIELLGWNFDFIFYDKRHHNDK